jgi:hypothetical protein
MAAEEEDTAFCMGRAKPPADTDRGETLYSCV